MLFLIVFIAIFKAEGYVGCFALADSKMFLPAPEHKHTTLTVAKNNDHGSIDRYSS